jgi:phosphate acetyltransferase
MNSKSALNSNLKQNAELFSSFSENLENRIIIFPESLEERVLKAAQMLVRDSIAKIILPAKNIADIKKAAQKYDIDLNKMDLIDIDLSLCSQKEIDKFIEYQLRKGLSRSQIMDILNEPLYFSMMYLKSKLCSACICGCKINTAEVVKSAISVIGKADNVKLISSYFLMIPPENHLLIKDPVLFADCAVNIDPGHIALKAIAVETIKTFKKIFPKRKANLAFLSFSSKGSSKTRLTDKIKEAVKDTIELFKNDENVNIDGELQFDACIIPEIAKRKAPDSKVGAQTNIFIFPDLNSGNISYKVAERLGGFQALGPIIQGLALPVSDLSRGCSAIDIYNVSSFLLKNI